MLPREPQCWSAPRCADTQRQSPGHVPVTDTLSHGGTRDIQERSQMKWVLDAVRFFRTSCYSQTGSFSPAAHPEHSPSFQKSRRAALELVSPISPFLSQPCPTGGSSAMSSCTSPAGRWKLSGLKIHSSPRSRKAILEASKLQQPKLFPKACVKLFRHLAVQV